MKRLLNRKDTTYIDVIAVLIFTVDYFTLSLFFCFFFVNSQPGIALWISSAQSADRAWP